MNSFEQGALQQDERLRDDAAMWGEEEEAGGEVNLADIMRSIWSAVVRNRWIIVAIVAVCLLGGLIASMLTVPRYRAFASVQIDQRAAKVLGTEDEEAYGSSADADRYLQTQVDVIGSRAQAIRVAQEKRLFNDDKYLAAVGIERSEILTQDRLRLAVLDSLQDNLTITLPRNSRIVKIGFSSRSPTVSADMANVFVKAYIESSLQRRFDQSAYARGFLSNQLTQAKARLAQSERDANTYAREQGLIDTSVGTTGSTATGGVQRSLATSDLVQLNQAFTQAQAALLQAQERWERARKTPLTSLPDVLSNPAVQELSRRRAELEASYQQERQRHKEDYPTVKQAQAGIDAIDQQIGTIAASILESIRYAYETASNQERAFSGKIDQLKRATLSEQDRSVQYNILKREADTNRQLYDGLLQRFREVSAASGATNNNIAMIDVAEPPARPFAPRPVLNLAIALLLGIMLSVAVVVMRELFDDAIREPGDTSSKLGLALLGVLPRSIGSDPMAEFQDHRSFLREASETLRVSLELSSSNGVPSTVLLTSSRQGEGKSTTAVFIAMTMAEAGKKVLLIDADLRLPSLHRYMDLENRTGLSTFLAGQAPIEAVTQKSATPNLSLISSGPIPPDAAQLLASSSLSDLIATCEQRYDQIIVDAPPVLGLADAPRLSSVVKAVIFVVEADRAHRGGAKAALKRLMSARAVMLGAVLTKFKAGHGSGDYIYYGNKPDTDKSNKFLGIFGRNEEPTASRDTPSAKRNTARHTGTSDKDFY